MEQKLVTKENIDIRKKADVLDDDGKTPYCFKCWGVLEGIGEER